jgi:hypothetical protein
MALWFFATDVVNANNLMTIGTVGANNHRHSLALTEGASTQSIVAQSRTTSNGIATASRPYTPNRWQHAAGVFAASNSRSAFMDGDHKNTNTTNLSPSGMNATFIGVNPTLSAVTFMKGRVALPAIWNVALSDAEVHALANGYMPWEIRRNNLVALWFSSTFPTLRDTVGDFNLSEIGDPQAIEFEPPKLRTTARRFFPVYIPSSTPPVNGSSQMSVGISLSGAVQKRALRASQLMAGAALNTSVQKRALSTSTLSSGFSLVTLYTATTPRSGTSVVSFGLQLATTVVKRAAGASLVSTGQAINSTVQKRGLRASQLSTGFVLTAAAVKRALSTSAMQAGFAIQTLYSLALFKSGSSVLSAGFLLQAAVNKRATVPSVLSSGVRLTASTVKRAAGQSQIGLGSQFSATWRKTARGTSAFGPGIAINTLAGRRVSGSSSIGIGFGLTLTVQPPTIFVIHLTDVEFLSPVMRVEHLSPGMEVEYLSPQMRVENLSPDMEVEELP